MEFSRGNLTTDLPRELPEEFVETLHKSTACRVERIVSRGHCSPPGFWYDQPEHEWVMVVQGTGILEFQGNPDPVTLHSGDYVNIPAHCKHRVAGTAQDQDTIWLGIFYITESAR